MDPLAYYRTLPLIDLVTALLIGEAEGERLVGMIAVANVLGNRKRVGKWFGTGLREVCLKPAQFSCFGADLPTRDAAMRAAIPQPPSSGAARRAHFVATELVTNVLDDITQGATHYIAPDGVTHVPDWVVEMTPTVRYGRHQFYR